MYSVSIHLLKKSFITRSLSTLESKSSIISKEIEKHNKLVKHWWDPNGILKGLHKMNNVRIPYIRKELTKVKQIKDHTNDNCFKGLKILDVGCGGGILTLPLAKLGGDVTGLDASSELVQFAKSYASQSLEHEVTLKFVDTTIEEYAKSNKNIYDVVILSEVLEHVQERQSFIQACVDTLKPGGSFFITTINRTFTSWFVAIFLFENVFPVIPKGHHEWSQLVSTEELKNYLTNANCKILQINGYMYIPIKNVWCRFPNNSVFYFAHAIKQS